MTVATFRQRVADLALLAISSFAATSLLAAGVLVVSGDTSAAHPAPASEVASTAPLAAGVGGPGGHHDAGGGVGSGMDHDHGVAASSPLAVGGHGDGEHPHGVAQPVGGPDLGGGHGHTAGHDRAGHESSDSGRAGHGHDDPGDDHDDEHPDQHGDHDGHGMGARAVSDRCQYTDAQRDAAIDLWEATAAHIEQRYSTVVGDRRVWDQGAQAMADRFVPLVVPVNWMMHYTRFGTAIGPGEPVTPDKLNSLIYGLTDDGWRPIGAMYALAGRGEFTPPEYGCIVEWHAHVDDAVGRTFGPTNDMAHLWLLGDYPTGEYIESPTTGRRYFLNGHGDPETNRGYGPLRVLNGTYEDGCNGEPAAVSGHVAPITNGGSCDDHHG